MYDTDSRGLESLDRSDASTLTTARVRTDGGMSDDILRDCLASIDYLTRTLLAAVRDAETLEGLETDDRETRRQAVRHVREIRAEVSEVGRVLIGPEAVIPYRPSDDPERGPLSTGCRCSFATARPDSEAEIHEGDGCSRDGE